MSKGFTIIELLVVIAIIGLLSTVVLVSVGGLRDQATIAGGQKLDTQLRRVLEAKGAWGFDNQNGQDGSGYGNTGTIYGGAGWSSDTVSEQGQSLSLDGSNDYMSAADSSSLRIVHYTVSVWIKPNGAPDETWKGIVGKPGRNYNIWLHQSGSIHHRFHNAGSANAGIPNTPNGSIKWDAWNHIVITNDGNIAKTFINGAEKASGSSGGDQIVNNTTLYVGRNLDGGTGRYFKGLIDEVRIYDKSLTSVQIERLYVQGLEKHQNLALR